MNFFPVFQVQIQRSIYRHWRYSYIIGDFVGLWGLEAVYGFNIIETGAVHQAFFWVRALTSSLHLKHRITDVHYLWVCEPPMCFVGFCAEKKDNWAFVSTVELPATMMIWEESKGLVTKQGWDSLQVNIQFFICLNSPGKIKNGTLTEMNVELDEIGLGILKLQTTLWMNHPAF